mgnify:CR=1 FL=1
MLTLTKPKEDYTMQARSNMTLWLMIKQYNLIGEFTRGEKTILYGIGKNIKLKHNFVLLLFSVFFGREMYTYIHLDS